MEGLMIASALLILMVVTGYFSSFIRMWHRHTRCHRCGVVIDYWFFARAPYFCTACEQLVWSV